VRTAALLDEIERVGQEQHEVGVGPSDYGRCRRQIGYFVRGHEQHEPIQSTRAALMGTLIHDGITRFVLEQYPSSAFAEFRLTIPGLDRQGAADLIWLDDDELVDLKTVNARSFDSIVTRDEPRDENVGQVETYALALNRRRIKVTTCTLAYINRENGDVAEFSWPYDEDSARERVSWLVNVEQMIADGMDMPRDGTGDGFPCEWCPFYAECWDVENTPDDRSHASKFTVSDAQIEDAIERYLDASAVESKAKALKSDARAQLVGIEYEANGYKLSWSGGKTTHVDEIDHDALVVLAVEAGLEVPMQRVDKTSSRTIRVKRVAS
jgi:hypothetical protein